MDDLSKVNGKIVVQAYVYRHHLNINLKIENYRYLKSLQLPSGWEERKPDSGIAQAITRLFSPADNGEARFKLFYRGLPLSEKSSESFRKALKLAPQILFDSNTNKLAESDRQLICNLEDSLGNVGNNQIANTDTGFTGPPFSLERLEVLVWNGKPVLKATGWFVNPKNGKRHNAFYGLFFDTSQKERESTVEEIFLEAKTEDLYNKSLPTFEECLHSIEWETKQLG